MVTHCREPAERWRSTKRGLKRGCRSGYWRWLGVNAHFCCSQVAVASPRRSPSAPLAYASPAPAAYARPTTPSPVTLAPQYTAPVSYPAHVAQAYPAQAYPAQAYPAQAYPAQAYPTAYPATAPAPYPAQYPSVNASVARSLSADTQVSHTITAQPAIGTVSTYKVCLKGMLWLESGTGIWRLTADGWGWRVETSN